MPVGMLRWYCPVYTSQLHFAVCAARLSALSTGHSLSPAARTQACNVHQIMIPGVYQHRLLDNGRAEFALIGLRRVAVAGPT